MKFINHARTHIKIYTFKDGARLACWKETPRIHNNSTFEQHQVWGDVELMIFVNRDGAEGTLDGWNLLHQTRYVLFDTRWGAGWDGSRFAPQHSNPSYKNTTSIVVTHHPDQRVVDYGKARKRFIDDIQALGGQADTNLESIDYGMAVGAAVINGLATGLAALGPLGALPGGGTMMLGNVLLAVIGGQAGPPPKPPNAAEISEVVKTVVTRELDIQDAEKAATAFSVATEDLLSICRDAYQLLVSARGQMTDGLRSKIIRLADSHTENRGEGTLRFSIEHLQRHPEIGRWILPVYVQGIGTWLAFHRFDILRTRLPDDVRSPPQIGVDDVQDFLDEVRSQRDALVAAFEAYDSHVKGEIRKIGLHETPLESPLHELITKSLFGSSDLSAIHQARGDLNVMIKQLEADVNGGTISNFWSATPLP